jgi:hypothetical protein
MASIRLSARRDIGIPGWTRLSICAALLLAPVGLRADSTVLHVLADSSRVTYFITHPLGDVRNTAGTPGGEVHVERAGAEWRLSGTITVDLRRLDTGIGQRTRHIQSEEYLDVERFPIASFEFTRVSCDSPLAAAPAKATSEPPATAPSGGATDAAASSAGEPPKCWKGRAVGRFTMHGVTRDQEVPVTLQWRGDRLRVQGHFRILLAHHNIKRVKKLVFAAGETTDVSIDLACVP